MLVVAEQERIRYGFEQDVFEGDIIHPDVWRQLTEQTDLARDLPAVILGAGSEQDKLRTALWIERRFANALVATRTNDSSTFALEVGAEHDIESISISISIRITDLSRTISRSVG